MINAGLLSFKRKPMPSTAARPYPSTRVEAHFDVAHRCAIEGLDRPDLEACAINFRREIRAGFHLALDVGRIAR